MVLRTNLTEARVDRELCKFLQLYRFSRPELASTWPALSRRRKDHICLYLPLKAGLSVAILRSVPSIAQLPIVPYFGLMVGNRVLAILVNCLTLAYIY